MFELTSTALVGYTASALVVISLTMTSVVRLRIISLLGSTTFLLYGALIESAPIILTNSAIVVINIWFLRREFASGMSGGIDLGASHIRIDSPYLQDFVAFHMADIHRYQPDFELPTGDDVTSWLLTRDGLPAGLLIGRRTGSSLMIDLDYVLGPYRDSRLGRWLFGRGADTFRRDGITMVRTAASTETHRTYLERMGFEPDPTSPGSLQLAL